MFRYFAKYLKTHIGTYSECNLTRRIIRLSIDDDTKND